MTFQKKIEYWWSKIEDQIIAAMLRFKYRKVLFKVKFNEYKPKLFDIIRFAPPGTDAMYIGKGKFYPITKKQNKETEYDF